MLRTGDKIDKYEIVGILGSGAFGTVYLVEWNSKKGKKSQGALKILKTPKPREVMREALTWARVSHHKNILTFLDAPEDGDQLLLLSEYAPDGSLLDWITNNGGAEEKREEAINLMCSILDGLAHLHDYNVIHRDIKPQNILLNNGTPLLADFGLARQIELSQSSMLAGTLPYMSPELFDVFLNKNLATAKYERTEADDLWATAITCYQMLTGLFPFLYPMQISSKDSFKISDKLPVEIQEFFIKALNKDEKERFETAEEMQVALKKAWEDTSPENKAKKYFEVASKLDDDDDWDGALKNYKKAIELNPKSAAFYLARGWLYKRKGESVKAIRDFDKAIELNPEFALAYNNRGAAYDDIGDIEQAIRDCKRSIKLDNKSWYPHYNLGLCYDRKNKDDLSIRYYNKAIKLEPDSYKAYNNRGRVYSKKGKHEQSIKDYSKAIELNSKYALAYENRAIIYEKIGEKEKAEADRKKFEELKEGKAKRQD